MKPDIGGPRMGPNVVAACYTLISSPFLLLEFVMRKGLGATYHENRHTPSPILRIMIDIRADPPNNTDRATPSHTHQQPEDDERSEVW